MTFNQLASRKWLVDNYEHILFIAYYLRDHKCDMMSEAKSFFKLDKDESRIPLNEITG